ncbi:hypothetical protein PAXINDRAFT_95682 [Paxillus involutus ATCC 200175]|nr:hypothetical protein PAXINDRAFT_95682 [Paxillus involutus ATCC 200175]
MYALAKPFTHETSNDDLASGHATSLTDVEQSCSNMLPNETLTAIFFGLSPAALTSIGRVCRQWRVVAEWILYTDVSISETLSATSPFPYNTLRCCQTLVTYSHLASGLRKFHIRWMPDHSDHYDPRLHTVLSSLFRAINLSDNLKSLELDLGLSSLPVHPTSTSLVFPSGDKTLRSLRHISLNGIGYFAPNRLAQFLDNVPSIQHLRLPDYGDQIALLPNALPSLMSFCGSSRAAAAVLPGRPVHALALIGHGSVADAELSRMAMTSIPLRHLDMSAISATPILLRSVSRNLPMIESLKVKLALRHTLHFAMSGIRLLAALSHLLGAFYRLSTLDLSPTHVDYTGLSNSAEELFLCQSWQRVCPSLRRVIFPSQLAWGYHEERQTWVSVLPKGSRKRPSFYSSSPMKKHHGALNS